MILIRRTFRSLIYFVAGLTAGAALFLIFIAWQFSKGPIPLGFLNPYIEAAINQENRDISIRMGETTLTWAGWDQALDIRVLRVRLVDQAGGTIGFIPEAAFSLSGDALLRAKLAPKSIDLFGPSLRFRRDRDGSIDVGFVPQTSSSKAVALGLIDTLLNPGHKTDFLSYLTRIAIIGADITFTDQVLDRSWHMPAANLEIERYIDRIKGSMSLVVDAGQKQTEFDFNAEYLNQPKEIELRVNFNGASPSMFAGITSGLSQLRHLDMPLSGEISLRMPINGDIDQVGMTVRGGSGRLHLPKPFTQTLNITAIEMDAIYNGNNNSGRVENFLVQLAPGSTLHLPAPLKHDLPLEAVKLNASFREGGLKWMISRFEADLEGPKLELKGQLEGSETLFYPVLAEFAATLNNTAVAKIPRIWPKIVAPKARDWVLQHISKGKIPRLNFAGKLRSNASKELLVDDLSGEMNVRNIVVDYLPPLPSVEINSARMEFNKSIYTIHIEKAQAHGLNMRSGTIKLTGLDQFDQFADINLVIDGPVPSQLDFTNHQALQLTSEIDIEPNQIKGKASTHLKLFFILKQNLDWEDIQVSAHSRLEDFSMSNIYKGLGFSNGQLELQIDKQGLDVSGTGFFEQIPVKIDVRENFIDTSDFRSRYSIKAETDNFENIINLDLGFSPLIAELVKGKIKAELDFTVLDKVKSKLRIMADLTDTLLSAPAFGWTKEEGENGRLSAILSISNNHIVGVPEFEIKAEDLSIRGLAKYGLNGTGLERIDFLNIKYGRTKMAGSLMPRGDGSWDAGFYGDSFDLSPMWDDILGQMSGADKFKNSLLDGLTLSVEMKKVWLDEKMAFNDLSGRFAREKNTWKTALLKAQISKNADFNLIIQQVPGGNRKLELTSNNAGKVLKFLDIYENMLGGKLAVNGIFNDGLPGQPLKGQITIRDYRVVNAPALARLLSIMALTGILEALEGEGLAFTDLAAPFELEQGTFDIKEARASGPSLGYTAQGKVFRNADIVDLKGTLIPVYALNSVFGHIPLLGGIFTGGEKGGGMFAATYTMTGPIDEPVVSVNPLSALAPGILRNVFGIIGKSRSKRTIFDEQRPIAPLQ